MCTESERWLITDCMTESNCYKALLHGRKSKRGKQTMVTHWGTHRAYKDCHIYLFGCYSYFKEHRRQGQGDWNQIPAMWALITLFEGWKSFEGDTTTHKLEHQRALMKCPGLGAHIKICPKAQTGACEGYRDPDKAEVKGLIWTTVCIKASSVRTSYIDRC